MELFGLLIIWVITVILVALGQPKTSNYYGILFGKIKVLLLVSSTKSSI